MGQRLVENFIVRSPLREIRKVQESMRMVEVEIDGKKISAQCIAAFTFPISRPGKKNLNNRVYPYALWDKLIREKQGERRFGVCDHPADDGEQPDGSVLKIFCVWRNMRYSEDKKLVIMDCYVFGGNGQLFVDAIRADGLPGFSSVGFGDFLEDGITIDPETYQLDRPADWVMNPSYEVFGSIEDEIALPDDSEEGHRIEHTSDTPRTTESESFRKRLTEERAMDKMAEQSYRLQLKGLRKEADGQPDIFGKLSAYKNILPFVEDESFSRDRNEINEAIIGLEKEIVELAKKGLKLDSIKEEGGKAAIELVDLKTKHETLIKENADLTKKLELATNLADGLKVYAQKLKELKDNAETELDTRFTATEYNEVQAYAEKLTEEIAALKKGKPVKEGTQFLGSQKPRVMLVGQRRRAETSLGDFPPAVEPEDEIEDAPLDDEEPVEDEPVEEADHPLPDYSDEHGIHGDLQVDTRPQVISEPDELQPIPMVADYVEDLIRRNPRVESISKELLACRGIAEAQRRYAQLKDLIEAADSKKNDIHRVTRRVIAQYRSVRNEAVDGSAKKMSGAGDLPLREGWS
jgi:hypothetical protein